MTYLVLIGLSFISLILQMTVPPILLGVPSQAQFTALVVIYAALKLRGPQAFFFSVGLGLLTDLLSPQILGTSIISLSLLVAFILLQVESLRLSHWSMQIFAALVGTFLFLILDYLLYIAQIQRWVWPFSLWTKIVFDALVSTCVAFLLFPIGDWLLSPGEPKMQPRRRIPLS
jgi:rod shape-determining protein MreD